MAACSPADNEPGPGGVTVGEAKALDQAAEMLDQQRLPPEAFEPSQPPPQTLERKPAQGEEPTEEPPPPPSD
ncbi:MAG: hypothetical protein R3D89_07665 [Sphingomonadaceae bacterium]